MNAVAMITPDPKYLATKNAHSGTPTLLCLYAKTGNTAPIFVSIGPVSLRGAPELTNRGP